MAAKYRLVTRSDFDGLVCAVLLKQIGLVGDILFVHPKDVQDGRVELGSSDITTNLPYNPYVHLCFDHHLSETMRSEQGASNHIMNAKAPSAARVVFEHYGGNSFFTNIGDDMMEAVDKSDAANLSMDDIISPKNWILLNYIMDPRTGLGRFRDFRISNYELMMKLIGLCTELTIEEIMEDPDVKERADLYNEHKDKAEAQLHECSEMYGNVIELDLREANPIWTTNRFMLYALYPQSNISIHILWGLHKKNVVFAVGKSIVNRSSNVNIGEIMLSYGGGGHLNAGTCQIPIEDAPRVHLELRQKLQG